MVTLDKTGSTVTTWLITRFKRPRSNLRLAFWNFSNFQINVSQKTVSFNVSGISGSAGFYRIIILNIIYVGTLARRLHDSLKRAPRSFKNSTEMINTYIYVNYTLRTLSHNSLEIFITHNPTIHFHTHNSDHLSILKEECFSPQIAFLREGRD